nr:nucleotide disphospho-sugar-binding domain-containing protein [Clostridium felsineum]
MIDVKKILFTPGIAAIEALGTITRLVALADEIRKRREDVSILFRAAGIEADYAEACGYKVIRGYKPHMEKIWEKENRNFIKESAPKRKFSINSLCDVIRLKGLISKDYVQNTFKEEMELVETFKPDIIFGEFEMIMPIVAKKMNIPYFSTGSTIGKKDFCYLGFSNKTTEGYAENYNELLEVLNLKTIENVCELLVDYNCDKTFIPSIPELEDLKYNNKNVFLGSITPKNFTKINFNFEKKRPLIYVYLSVGEVASEVCQKVILDTFLNSEFDVIATAGGNPRFKDSVNYSAKNVHFLNMVPSDEVLKMTDVAIHHGGQNTTVQCIENRVPAIIFPGKHFERSFNAEKAAEIGCALNTDIENFNKEFLLKTCREIIKDNTFKEKLKIYSDEIKSFGGAAKAAEIILNY